MNSSAQRASAAGIAGATVIVAATLIAGAAFPGYDHARQFISELGATGAPHGELVTFAGFLPAGVLVTLFAWHAARALPRSRATLAGLAGVALYAFGYLTSVPFRCDYGCRPDEPSLSQVLHNLGGAVSYLLGAIGLLALGVAARRWPGGRLLAWLGIGGGVVSLLAFPGLSHDFEYAGVAQRLIEASMLGWILACAFHLRRHAGQHVPADSTAGRAVP